MIAIGAGGEPGTYTSTGSTASTPPAVELAGGAQAAGAGVGADGDERLRLGHHLPCALQRPAHRRGHGAGDQQHVGVARGGGEEEAEPLDVVVGVPQRLDLPLLRAVRAAVDVADVDRAAQRPCLLAERARGSARARPVVLTRRRPAPARERAAVS